MTRINSSGAPVAQAWGEHALGYSTGTCGKDGQGAPVADAQPTLRIPSVVIGGKLK